ncbi:MG2 domain-containing protein [Bacteroidota bacterium]
MKTSMTIFSRIIIVLLLAGVFSCKQESKQAVPIDPGFTSYISAFTSGYVSKQASIRIRLAEELPEDTDPVIVEKAFKLSPSVKGEAYLIDNRTIEFRPEEDLESGTTYKVSFELDQLVEVPENLRTFTFDFQTIEQNFSVSHEGIRTYDPKNLRWLYLSGTFETADVLEESYLSDLLRADQGSFALNIRWEHDPQGRSHTFIIDSIERKEKEDLITVEWDGKKIGSESKGREEVSIPALSDFKIMDISVVQQPQQYVSLKFSDPLKEKQYLNGLITLDNETDLSFIVENNEIRAYPSVRQTGEMTVFVSSGIRNILDYKLKAGDEYTVSFEEVKPAVRLIGQGVILPSSDGLIFPFEAVNLKAVEVRIVRIYENNIGQFLQVNYLDGEYQLKRVGRLILRKTIQLNTGNIIDFGKWNAYSLDLSKLIESEPGAIYRIELGFKKKHSLFPCDDLNEEEDAMSTMEDDFDQSYESELSYWDAAENYYSDDYYYYYDWNERDDPCSPSYYGNHRSVARNIIASDLGIIVKKGSDNSLTVAVTDIRTTGSISGVEIEVFNYQQQQIGSTRTDDKGIARVSLENKPFLLIARHGEQRAYLRLDDGSSLSLSRFDVSGNVVQKGVKAFIYGERGVWRPGDTLFLTFLLEDRKQQIPANHPVSFELLNTSGQVVKKMTRGSSAHGFYSFIIPTHPDAPTGNWTARIRIGGLIFTKWLRIETVKPNRLKINLDFGTEKLSVSDPSVRGELTVTWLHGAVARNLRANVSVVLNQMKTRFDRFQDYNFDDPVRSFYAEEHTLFDSRLGENGKASFSATINTGNSSPGMLKAGFVTRVFEEGGEFSIDRFTMPYSPYKGYVGIKTPKGDKARGMLLTDTTHTVELITVDPDGNPVSRSNLDVKIYKVSWRWWWDAGYDNLASFVGNSEHQPVFSTRVDTRNGEGSFRFRIDYPEWGRYLIRVLDPVSGHASGQTVYIDWPGWAGRAQRENPGGAAMLSFSADKQNYQVGEIASISIPSSGEGRALVSIENGSGVIDAHWVEATEPETRFDFEISPEMAPNIYVNVSLLQPHANSVNDLPIRLYGVIPLMVEDPQTRLFPELEMPDVLRPEEEFHVKISEQDGKECTYTIAMVDEGLLDLTRFPTPSPWDHFYAREALGVRTWDVYDAVLGAYGGKIEQIFAIGGGFDEEDAAEDSQSRAMRFKPMVRFLGPYTLGKGESRSHSIKMPKYIGSVRTMVVAGNQFAYGKTEKTTAVKKPLMVLATLPRVLGPNEQVSLPVTVFAMEDNIRNVRLEVKTNELLELSGSGEKRISFETSGDQLETFQLKVGNKVGIGKVEVTAKSGSETASYEIELDVRNPNPPVTDFIDEVVEVGQSLEKSYSFPGIPGTNTATLEVSNIPPIDFGRRLKYLLGYPHGCIEQTTSAAFPQLYIGDVTDLDNALKTKTESNINAAIKRLQTFLLPSGGFAYWPGSSEASHWATSYAGHFLIEAENKGFVLPGNIKKQWTRFQSKEARRWKKNAEAFRHDDLVQAYRLYTLALAGEPDLGAMNRLREMDGISVQSRWRLAAAYALAGQTGTAEELVREGIPDIKEYPGFNYSYGSRERDLAMILESLVLMDKRSEGAILARQISDQLRSKKWMSTQTTAYCLMAMSKFAGSEGVSNELKFSYQINGGDKTNASTRLSIAQIELEPGDDPGGNIRLDNLGEGIVFVRITMEGIPETGTETAAENNLNMSVRYTDMNGNPLDISRLQQGVDFLVHVSLRNPFGVHVYKDMALSQIFPSGWEIHNSRMDELGSVYTADQPTYQDIRDDRVYTYFDIRRQGSNNYVIQLNAAYLGKYYLPAVYCEAMYDETVNALIPGRWVEIVKTE